ncbi:hypothetical protein P170DRAFT_325644, partial [Aspergillus steynii IBT 23096]
TIISSFAVILSLIAATLAISKHIPHKDSQTFHFECGETPSDAARLGCKFDLSAFAWVPPACFDGEMMEDFLNSSDWKWSLDREGQQMVSEEYARTGDFEYLYTTATYHATHCKYAYKRLTRAMLLRDQSGIDGYIGGIGHVDHCMHMIEMAAAGNTDIWGTGKAYTKMASCGQGVFESGNGWFGWDNGQKIWELP